MKHKVFLKTIAVVAVLANSAFADKTGREALLDAHFADKTAKKEYFTSPAQEIQQREKKYPDEKGDIGFIPTHYTFAPASPESPRELNEPEYFYQSYKYDDVYFCAKGMPEGVVSRGEKYLFLGNSLSKEIENERFFILPENFEERLKKMHERIGYTPELAYYEQTWPVYDKEGNAVNVNQNDINKIAYPYVMNNPELVALNPSTIITRVYLTKMYDKLCHKITQKDKEALKKRHYTEGGWFAIKAEKPFLNYKVAISDEYAKQVFLEVLNDMLDNFTIDWKAEAKRAYDQRDRTVSDKLRQEYYGTKPN